MYVLVVELLCQAVTGQIPTVECLLPSAHGHLWLCLVLSDIKWPYLRTPTLEPLARYLGYPRTWVPEAWAHDESGHEDKVDRPDRW
jgi:hypothetical protein